MNDNLNGQILLFIILGEMLIASVYTFGRNPSMFWNSVVLVSCKAFQHWFPSCPPVIDPACPWPAFDTFFPGLPACLWQTLPNCSMVNCLSSIRLCSSLFLLPLLFALNFVSRQPAPIYKCRYALPDWCVWNAEKRDLCAFSPVHASYVWMSERGRKIKVKKQNKQR